MTAATAFTAAQLSRIDRHTRDLDREIAERCAEQRDIAGHALAVIARATHPDTESVIVPMVDQDGTFGPILCKSAHDGSTLLPEDVVSLEVIDALTLMFRRLPHGDTGIWKRDLRTTTLDVAGALSRGNR